MDHTVTHTAAEAIQNLDVIEGATPPPVILPLIFEPPTIVPLPGNSRELWESLDTFLVEISDRTVVRAGDWVLQVNFLVRNLVQKHPMALFQWYKELSTTGAASKATIAAAVEKLKSADIPDLELLTDVLRHARLERQTAEQVIGDMQTLVARREARWIFASHFLAPGDDGAIMTDRRCLIEAVRRGAEAVEAEFFDASALVERHGRKVALAAGGADLFEYAEPFNEVVASALLDTLENGGRKPTESVSARMQRKQPTYSQDPKAAIATVNKELIRIHRKRLAKLGTDESGLFQHYEALLHQGSLFLATDTARLAFVLDYLPAYDRYVVYRAGLGELGFALALMGRRVTVWEPNGARRQAIREAFEDLSKEHAEIRSHFELADVPKEEIPLPAGERTLGLAFNLLLIGEGADEEAASRFAGRTDAFAFAPRHFLRTRPEETAGEEARTLLRKAGYDTFEILPLAETILAKRTGADAAPNSGQGRLRFSAGD